MKFADDVWRFTHDHWPLLAPVLLGFLAVYWLLPSVRRSWLVPGIVVGAAALVSAGWLLIYQQFATVEAVLFYAFSGPAVLGGVLMLAQHNPVRAALAFALVVLSTCGLFLLLAAPFLMAATIIIYAGAIIITFLFVVMLAQQSGAAGADMRAREPFLASLAGFVLLAGLLVVLQRNYDTRGLDAIIGKVQAVVSATSPEEVRQALGEPKQNNLGNWPFVSDGPALEDEDNPAVKALLKAHYTKVAEKVGNIEHAWTAFRSSKKADEQKQLQAKLQENCAALLTELRAARAGQGSLEPEEKLKVNAPGSVPRNVLPARNVEAVGKTLFSDYLIAVEEAGLLLLVATIGAIVIAQRRDPVLGKAAKGGQPS